MRSKLTTVVYRDARPGTKIGKVRVALTHANALNAIGCGEYSRVRHERKRKRDL